MNENRIWAEKVLAKAIKEEVERYAQAVGG